MMLRPGQTKSGHTDAQTDAKHLTKHVTAIINFIAFPEFQARKTYFQFFMVKKKDKQL